MKTILLNVLTHGDEKVGRRVADEVSHRYPNLIGKGLTIQIANPRAFNEKKRYVDMDLNRVFPGKADGSYEEKRAFELVPVIASYDVVIDIHSTESGSGDMVIVTKLDEATREMLQYLEPRYVLCMSIGSKSALISSARVGIAFEMGSDTDERTFKKTMLGIERILSYAGYLPEAISRGYPTEFYEVFAPVPKPAGAKLEPHIENFKLIKAGDIYARDMAEIALRAEVDFYPVIFGNSNYEKIFGFAARLLIF